MLKSTLLPISNSIIATAVYTAYLYEHKNTRLGKEATSRTPPIPQTSAAYPTGKDSR